MLHPDFRIGETQSCNSLVARWHVIVIRFGSLDDLLWVVRALYDTFSTYKMTAVWELGLLFYVTAGQHTLWAIPK